MSVEPGRHVAVSMFPSVTSPTTFVNNSQIWHWADKTHRRPDNRNTVCFWQFQLISCQVSNCCCCFSGQIKKSGNGTKSLFIGVSWEMKKSRSGGHSSSRHHEEFICASAARWVQHIHSFTRPSQVRRSVLTGSCSSTHTCLSSSCPLHVRFESAGSWSADWKTSDL